MPNIDDELAAAVRESEEATEATEQPLAVEKQATPSKPPKRSVGLLVALLVMGGVILGLVLTGTEDGVVYSKDVDELSVGSSNDARKVRVQGTLVKGTLVRRDTPCEYRFKMEKNGKVVEVRYPQCVVPDTFRDVPGMDVDVTAEGRLSEAGFFQASNIMAKCPSKYDMKQRAQQGEQAPHDAVLPAGAAAQAR